MSNRHFLSLLDLSSEELLELVDLAIETKKALRNGISHTPLKGKTLAMIFDKASTRTRVSFETGMVQLGGHAMFLSPRDTQLGRGEPIADSARVISSMVDLIMIRTYGHDLLESLANFSSVPVINGLTDLLHPCQLLADMQTWFEHRGNIRGATVAWIGDGNNVCHSYINAAIRFDFNLTIGCPNGHLPDAQLIASAGDRVRIVHSAEEAATDADLIVTDVWASMGQEGEQAERLQTFEAFQVNKDIMAKANSDALFTHCLPAHREEEVTTDVLEGPQSIVFQAAENRLHAQKALMELLVSWSRT